METGDDASLQRCLGRLLAKVRRSSRRWSLVPAQGRLAIGVSGGADSLAMVFLLAEHARRLAAPLDLLGLHVPLAADGTTAGMPEAVRAWCARVGVEVEEVSPRFERDERPPFDCFGCARIRRRTLLEAADWQGAPTLALGHHADDVVETWLLALLYTGTAEVLPPRRVYFGGAVTVIRPLYELRRSETRRLVALAGLELPDDVCPRSARSRRVRVVGALAALGGDQGRVRRQLFWAVVRQYERSAEQAGAAGLPADEPVAGERQVR